MNTRDFRKVAIASLHAQDSLLLFWRNVNESEFAKEATTEDVILLRELILRRIYPVNAFSVLVRIDQNAAIDILLSRYLGVSVDPDKKFGGFEFELETMLDDLLEVGGEPLIVQLVRHPKFALERSSDPRLSRILANLLQIEQEQVTDWVSSKRRGS